MRSLPIFALGLAGLGAAAHVGHRHRDVHKKRDIVTETEITTVVSWVTEVVTDPVDSSSTSTEDGIFFENHHSSSSTTTSETPSPPPAQPVASSSTTTTTTTPAPAPPSATQPKTTSGIQVSLSVGIGGGNGAGSGGGAAPPPGYTTMTIMNKHGMAVSTSHNDHGIAASSNGVALSTGLMSDGEVSVMTMRLDWVGNIALSEGHYSPSGDSTLLEANYGVWAFTGEEIADCDVSYVTGYTVPAVCGCAGVWLTGCNIDLFASSTCPDLVDGACRNPLRNDFSARKAVNFFSECENAAWTFVEDGKSDSQCRPGEEVVCCIGKGCPPSIKQRKKN